MTYQPVQLFWACFNESAIFEEAWCRFPIIELAPIPTASASAGEGAVSKFSNQCVKYPSACFVIDR